MGKDGQDQSLQDKKQRGRVKKWSKKSLQGNIMSRTQHIECLKLGVSVTPFLVYGSLPQRPGECIELPGCLPASQLRDLMLHSMMSDQADEFSAISRKGDRHSPRLRISNVASLRGIVVMAFSGLPISLNHKNNHSATKSCTKVYKDDDDENVGGCDDIILNNLSPSFIEKFQYRTKLRISGGKRTSSIADELLYCTKGDMAMKRRRYRSKKRARADNNETEEKAAANGGFEPYTRRMTSDGFPSIQHYIMSRKDLLKHDYPLATESYLSSLAPPAPDSAFTDYRRRQLLRNGSLPMQLPSLEEARIIISECVPEIPGLEGYVSTLPTPRVQEKNDLNDKLLKVFALDCEMCEVEGGRSELIRISLVNDDSQVIIDTLVVPSEPVTDYRTQWSGVTADMLVGVSTHLHQVQAALLLAICDKDILVGHSMDNDLKALRICHQRCVDTSVLYPHPQTGRKSSLRHLAKLYLKRDIQSDKDGHCSVQDSVAALDLALLKISNGPEFGAEGERINMLEKFTENGMRCTFAGDAATCAAHGTAGSTCTIVLKGGKGDAARLTKKECLKGGALASPTHQFSTATDGVAAALDNDGIEINSHKLPNSPGVLWLQMPIRYTSPSPSLQELARSDFTKLCEGKLRHCVNDVETEASLVLDTLPNDVMVVVALQHEERLPKEMLKWRKRCLSGGRGGGLMMASTWSTTQDELLQHFLGVTQIGYALLSVSR